MSLSVLEQIEFINTNTNASGVDFRNIIKQVGVEFSHDFLTTMKIVDGSTAPEAKAYTNKMTGFIRRCLQGETNAISILMRVMFVIVGDTAATYDTINTADGLQVANFFRNNIQKCFEVGAVIEKEEVDAYNNVA